MRLVVVALLALPLQQPAAGAASAREVLAGPIPATVVRVIGGDTFVAEAHVWPGHRVRVAVRIRGIDAPEMRSRCARERAAAERARSALKRLIGDEPVLISNVGGGKYHGRVLADVATAGGREAGRALLEAGLARPYEGGRRVPFCD